MSTFFSFAQIMFGTTSHYIYLVVDIMIQCLFQCQNLWHTIYQRQHNHTKVILQLSIFIQLIQNNLWIYISAQFDYDTHPFTVRLVTQIGNTVDFFVSCQFGNFFYQSCFVYLVWNFCYYDAMFAIVHWLNFASGTNFDRAAACQISIFNAFSAQNNTAAREVRTFDILQQFSVFHITIVNQSNGTINYFP